MSDTDTRSYEGMFLFPQAAASNMQAAVDHLRDILGRAEASIISMRKWDERRLAYEIKGNKRGLYFMVYFDAPGSSITRIERDCNLSELMLRHLIIRAEHVSREQMEAADGQTELADEIKLRDQEQESAPARAATVTTTAPATPAPPATPTTPAPPAATATATATATADDEPASEPASGKDA